MEPCRCDLCGSESHRVLPRLITTKQLSVAHCRSCGALYTNPRWSRAEIAGVYERDFEDDPGAVRCRGNSDYRESDLTRSTNRVETRIIPAVQSFLELEGKQWLELRFRSGALLKRLCELGADVTGVDPFEANLEFVRKRVPEAKLHRADVWDLLAPVDGPFDVISMLSIHVLAHVPSPTALLQACYQRLTPGGMLFIDEKDVLQLGHNPKWFPFEYPYGMAHYHHLTLNVVKATLLKVGFEILHADFNDDITANRHFFIAARRPQKTTSTAQHGKVIATKPLRYGEVLGRYAKFSATRAARKVAGRITGRAT